MMLPTAPKVTGILRRNREWNGLGVAKGNSIVRKCYTLLTCGRGPSQRGFEH